MTKSWPVYSSFGAVGLDVMPRVRNLIDVVAKDFLTSFFL